MNGKLLWGDNAHPGSALGPGMWNLELLGMYVFPARGPKRRHSPGHAPLDGRRTRHPATDFIGQAPQVGFKRRWLQRHGDDSLRISGSLGLEKTSRYNHENSKPRAEFLHTRALEMKTKNKVKHPFALLTQI
jgi:hypothetical protein